MSKSYEDYEQEYQSYLSRIRSFLASTRSKSTLLECERLLAEARKCTTAMQAMAAVEGSIFRIEESQNLARRDLAPLQEEIRRGLRGERAGDIEEVNREDLFYRPPVEGQNMTTQMLITTSTDLLRETQALVADSEQIGMSTLTQMSMQREQMQFASDDLNATINASARARQILKSMRNKLFKNKIFLYAMIAVLLFLNGWVLRAIWKRHHHK